MKVMDNLRDKIAHLINPMAFTEPTAQNSILYGLVSFEEGRKQAYEKSDKILEALPHQILDAIALVDGYEWSGSEIRDHALTHSLSVFTQEMYAVWLNDQRVIREKNEAAAVKAAELARKTEATARLLCQQDGHDPDGGPRVGFGWRNYEKNATDIMLALGVYDD